jgi:predicted secreted protein
VIRRALAIAAATCVLAVAGCGGTSTVEVAVGAGSVQVARGDTLLVDLGRYNASIGDSWHLIEPPDPAVLSEGDQEYDADCDAPGCGGRLTWRYLARGPGTTTLGFRYCYRSKLDSCQAQPDRGPDLPVKLTVTVT